MKYQRPQTTEYKKKFSIMLKYEMFQRINRWGEASIARLAKGLYSYAQAIDVVKGWVETGLVKREKTSREVMISLTDKGREAMEVLHPAIPYLKDVFGSLPVKQDQ